VVVEGVCGACSTHAVRIHHQSFPELRLEGESAEMAASLLIERLLTAFDSVADPTHRETVQVAVADLRAFLDRRQARG
jgi:hypothetical protein